MERRFIVIVFILASLTAFLSFNVRSCTAKRAGRVIEEVESEKKVSFLDFADDYEKKGDYVKARAALKEFIRQYPDSENAQDIKKRIEKFNIKILFSSVETDDSFMYKIKPGDALVKIAYTNGTTVELLKTSNALKTDLIMPGKTLKINKTGFMIFVDKSDNILTLKKKDGEIVKTYTVSTGENLCTPTGTFTIEEKLVSPVWYKVGAVVEPSSSEYELGSRWMGLSVAGYGIHGTKDESTIGNHVTKGCVRMRNDDVNELYAIVPSGAEVVISE